MGADKRSWSVPGPSLWFVPQWVPEVISGQIQGFRRGAHSTEHSGCWRGQRGAVRDGACRSEAGSPSTDRSASSSYRVTGTACIDRDHQGPQDSKGG